MNRLVLAASSVADDLGFVALADLSAVLGPARRPNHRLIGLNLFLNRASQVSIVATGRPRQPTNPCAGGPSPLTDLAIAMIECQSWMDGATLRESGRS